MDEPAGQSIETIANSESSTEVGRSNIAFDKHGKRITKLCIAASIPFLILVLAHVMLGVLVTELRLDIDRSPIAVCISSLATVMMSLNHSINFVIYCLVSKGFREDLMKIICGKCRKYVRKE